jgi:dienelactone hydrolase
MWSGAALGAILAAVLLVAHVAWHLRSGLGTAADVVVAVAAAGLGIAALAVVVLVVRSVLGRWPAFFAAGFLGSFVFVFVLLDVVFDAGHGVSLQFAATLVLLSAALGAGVGMLVGRTRQAEGARRRTGWALLAAGLAGWIALGVWLWLPGTDPYVALQPPPEAAAMAPPAAEDPSQKGRHVVRALTYGSGTDRRRPEYGSGAALRTEPVDASPLVKNLKGVKAKLRAWYWGFGGDRFPLNGRVWYPEGGGPFPLVLVVHGNHRMEDYSDPGYAYLGELLASRGFIVVSVDENFLNRSWSGDIGGETGARGWMLLQHLATWRRWNDTPGHPFHGRVDMERIGLIGHSRGGEAVAHAATFNRLPCLPDDCRVKFDFRFSIRALVALAPVDDGYRPAGQSAPIEDVSYLVLHGSHDADVPNFEGRRPFKRVRFSDGRYRFKAALYIHRANHGQFNTVWGGNDLGPPLERFVVRRSLLTGAEQRRVVEVFVGGFLEATLNDRVEYVPMFRDVRSVGRWLPRTTYFSQFEDSTYRVVSDFDTGLDLTRGALPGSSQAGENLTVWREGDFKGRGAWPFRVRTLYLGWDRAGSPAAGKTGRYRITLPDTAAATWALGPNSRLVFAVADARDDPGAREARQRYEPVDFTIELVTADGVAAQLPLSGVLPLPPLVRVTFTKWRYLDHAFYAGKSEPVFQTYELPLGRFAAAGWEPARLREIRFLFDRTPSGRIMLDGVGFAFPSVP